jgi:hypothetical protein
VVRDKTDFDEARAEARKLITQPLVVT